MQNAIACTLLCLLVPAAWAQMPDQPITQQAVKAIVEAALNKQAEKQPPIQPKFTALKARLTVPESPDNLENPSPEEKNRLLLKARRNETLQTAIQEQSNDRGEIFIQAQQSILNVCNDGFSYLSQKIKNNMLDDTRVLFATAAAGLVSGGTGSLVTAKVAGVMTAGIAAYKQREALTIDTEDSNKTLQAMMEDIRSELSQAAADFNRAFIADVSADGGAKRLQGMKASLLAMNNACSFY